MRKVTVDTRITLTLDIFDDEDVEEVLSNALDNLIDYTEEVSNAEVTDFTITDSDGR